MQLAGGDNKVHRGRHYARGNHQHQHQPESGRFSTVGHGRARQGKRHRRPTSCIQDAVHEMSTHCAVLAPRPQNTENKKLFEFHRYLPGSSGDNADEALDIRLQVLQFGPSVKFVRHCVLQLHSRACRTA